MNRRLILSLTAVLAIGACNDQQEPNTGSAPGADFASATSTVGINVVLKAAPTKSQLDRLNAIGSVKTVYKQINGLTMAAGQNQLATIRALPFVQAAAVDAEINLPPVDPVPLEDFTGGFSTWNQDAIDVTKEPGSSARDVTQTGRGVFVGVLDSGLLNNWRQYFPEERIAEEYAATVVGGGAADQGRVVVLRGEQWENDVCSHGTHVTSTILGFRFLDGRIFQGTAPEATVIPVRFKAQHSANTVPFGCGWFSSMSAAGLIYYGELKRDVLKDAPLVVNNSWGGPADPLVRAAVKFAQDQGVLLVASAGNSGTNGMGYPGAWPEVISAAASGLVQQRVTAPWWNSFDVPEPTAAEDFYIASFSSREIAATGQDLDIAAPGSLVVGPYQLNMGQTSWFFLNGTSMAAPHITGTVALMLQKKPSLTQAQAESILERTAVPMGAGCRVVRLANGAPPTSQICWGDDATGSGLLNADAAVARTR